MLWYAPFPSLSSKITPQNIDANIVLWPTEKPSWIIVYLRMLFVFYTYLWLEFKRVNVGSSPLGETDDPKVFEGTGAYRIPATSLIFYITWLMERILARARWQGRGLRNETNYIGFDPPSNSPPPALPKTPTWRQCGRNVLLLRSYSTLFSNFRCLWSLGFLW